MYVSVFFNIDFFNFIEFLICCDLFKFVSYFIFIFFKLYGYFEFGGFFLVLVGVLSNLFGLLKIINE